MDDDITCHPTIWWMSRCKSWVLFTHNAKYNPDSVVFKANLDDANDDDAHRRNSKSRGKVNLLKEYKARTRSVIRLNESTRIITARKF